MPGENRHHTKQICVCVCVFVEKNKIWGEHTTSDDKWKDHPNNIQK